MHRNVPPTSVDLLINAVRPQLQKLIVATQGTHMDALTDALIAFQTFPRTNLLKHRGFSRRVSRKQVQSQLQCAAANLPMPIPKRRQPPSAVRLDERDDEQKQSDKQAASVTNLMLDARYKQAVRRIEGVEVADMSDEHVFLQVRAGFAPLNGKTYADAPAQATRHVVTEPTALKKVLAKMDAGASPGPSGWTVPLLRVLMNDEVCAQGLSIIITMLKNWTIPMRARPFFTDSEFVGIYKRDRRVRNINITDVLCRAAIRVIDLEAPTGLELFPDGIQFGVGIPGGSQTALHKIQLTMEQRQFESEVVHDFHGDISDAFPSTKLECAFRVIDNDPKYAAYLRFAHGYYGNARTIHTGVGPAMTVDDGISAGEAFASKFFCATVHPIYRQAREAGRAVDPKLELTAICDDMHITGTVPGIRAAHMKMKAGFIAAGYTFNDAKCGLLDPRAASPAADGETQGFTAEATQFATDLGCTLEKGAVAALGGVIGHDEIKRRHFVTQRFESAADKFEKTLHSNYMPAHLSLNFTRHVLATQHTHLLSVVPPSVSRLGAVIFQHRAQHAVADKLNIEEKFRTQDWVTQFTARVGGFGLSLPLNWPLYMASVSRMFQQFNLTPSSSFYYTVMPPNFPSAPPGFQVPFDAQPLQVRMQAMPSTIRESVAAMQFGQLARDGGRPPNFKPMAPESFLRDALVSFELTTKAIVPPLSKALMSDITQLMDYQYFASGTSGNQELKQRMEELHDSTARRFFYSGSLADHHLVISDVEYALMIRSALAIPFGVVDLGHKCRCGKIFDAHHPQACTLVRRREVTHRHNSVVGVIARFAAQNGMTAYTEPLFLSGDSRVDLDIHMNDAAGTIMSVDVSILHRALSPQGKLETLLNTREDKKRNKYVELCEFEKKTFLAGVSTSMGVLAKDFKFLIETMAKRAYAFGFTTDWSATYREIVLAVLVALHRGNVAIQERGVRLCRPKAGES